ncbi:MAG: hypothetical protein CME67_06850 [Halobacteriovoraceae bacterium]|nr:hypothetical protein [Halobacteriovoraceae bacterium]|tara:strand:+ start:476 stop:844 length:369 start_codon:yes stop_codon:yes gene_type:complete
MLFIRLLKLSSILWLALSYNINAEISAHLAEHHFAHGHDHAHVHVEDETQTFEDKDHEHRVVDIEAYTALKRSIDTSQSWVPLSAYQLAGEISFSKISNNFKNLKFAFRPPPDKFRNLPMLN